MNLVPHPPPRPLPLHPQPTAAANKNYATVKGDASDVHQNHIPNELV